MVCLGCNGVFHIENSYSSLTVIPVFRLPHESYSSIYRLIMGPEVTKGKQEWTAFKGVNNLAV